MRVVHPALAAWAALCCISWVTPAWEILKMKMGLESSSCLRVLAACRRFSPGMQGLIKDFRVAGNFTVHSRCPGDADPHHLVQGLRWSFSTGRSIIPKVVTPRAGELWFPSQLCSGEDWGDQKNPRAPQGGWNHCGSCHHPCFPDS